MTGTAPGEVVLALAGHVDHGKSALVGALTGQATDRRQAERARGLTVDLGHLVLAGERPVAVTDVPGHVDYLANTLVGLAGATHALLVVAADDGWMPQTEDHVRAARHLGVPVAVAAVTKADLVAPDRVVDVVADVTARLADDGPAVVVASGTTGDGVAALADLLAAVPAPAVPGTAPSLWVDRAFRVEGRGLVVAGTLLRGTLSVGDQVTVAPSGRVGRVRGLQQHGRAVTAASGPGRVAVDLADATAARGDRLLAGALGARRPATATVDVWLEADAAPGIGERGAWLVHVGSTEVEAEVRPFADDPVRPRAGAPVRLRLQRRVPLVAGDRFVVRDVGRRVVAGGGVVLDPAPSRGGRGRAARDERAATLAELRGRDGAEGLLWADGGVTPTDRLVTATGDPGAAVGAVAGHAVASDWWERLGGAATELLADAGPDGRPVDAVVAELVRALGASRELVRAGLERVDGVARRDTRLVLAGRRDDLDATRRAATARLHELLRATPLDPEPLDVLVARAGVVAADLDRLLRAGHLLRSGEFGFLPAAVDLVVGRLRALEDRVGAFTVGEARGVLGITRKHAVPWMELLDRLGATTRDGDRRRVSRPG